ncbi:hypothetical protein O9G_003239 [Rozella allomycis CSF55]|uniref:Uncharacterized protein n=1 Tax=Rozella allomycis (strain CSF55) TaxID=988480 RepID=A0A075ASY2_ROZAC|nr:hypothetical protein O9G_003239 [Rozella allomycis CSF55]|eukprot:EPZ33378.1 hypothetical protein O9G_003239 [Rozella allomycis CSF55]
MDKEDLSELFHILRFNALACKMVSKCLFSILFCKTLNLWTQGMPKIVDCVSNEFPLKTKFSPERQLKLRLLNLIEDIQISIKIGLEENVVHERLDSVREQCQSLVLCLESLKKIKEKEYHPDKLHCMKEGSEKINESNLTESIDEIDSENEIQIKRNESNDIEDLNAILKPPIPVLVSQNEEQIHRLETIPKLTRQERIAKAREERQEELKKQELLSLNMDIVRELKMSQFSKIRTRLAERRIFRKQSLGEISLQVQ